MRVLRVALLSVIAFLMLWSVIEANEGLDSRGPITILSDEDFTAGNGVRSGSGAIDDPYVISDWLIDAEQSSHCIRIENVSSVFLISRCVLVGASGYAVKLVDVESAEIVRSCVSASLFGVLLESCKQCHIRDCSFAEIEWTGLTFIGSNSCQVEGCLFIESKWAIVLREGSIGSKVIGNVFLPEIGTAIRLEAQCGGNLMYLNDFHTAWCYSDSYNRWSSADGRGNYWSRYKGKDEDGDGVGDTPAIMLGGTRETDRYPVMVPHHPEAETEWYLCEPKE